MSENARRAGCEPKWQPIEMLPVVTSRLWSELNEANELVREMAEASPNTRINPAMLDELAHEYDDDGAWHGLLAQQLARWRHDHPNAAGLNEFAELLTDLEPCRHRLLEQIAHHRRHR